MKNVMKTLMVCLIVTLTFFTLRTAAIAQVGWGTYPLWQFPAFNTQPLQMPVYEDPYNGTGDILVDNFEYWDSPYNHGWIQQEPPYPVYGYGIGYATIFNTVMDLQEGSRVLDVYRPNSIFIVSTQYEKHRILHSLGTPASSSKPQGEAGISIEKNPVVSFDFRAPLGIETFDIFEFTVIGETAGGNIVSVQIVPLEPPAGSALGPVNSTAGMFGAGAVVTGFAQGQLQVTVIIGRGMLDGSWHAVWVDLDKSVKAAVDVFSTIDEDDKEDWYIERANAVMAGGQMFRLDNLFFRSDYGYAHIGNPDFFEMGPLYAQIFEPYRYLFIADYEVPEDEIKITDLMLNPANFILTQDPNDPDDPVVKYWTDLGADPNRFGENDPAIAEIFNRQSFTVDLSQPIFADPNLRMTADGPGSAAETIINSGTLGWNSTIGGYGANGVQAFLLQPLPVYPYDGMPTYLPAKYGALNAVLDLGKPYFQPGLIFLLEGAMWNAGFTVWPNIAALDFTPQVFEDLIVTIEVTNGSHSDVRTFPISVVNYPVENYPPVLQLNIEDQIFYVGQQNGYIVNFIDPDCFIFSLSSAPATTHIPGFPISGSFRTDMDDLHWAMTINGMTAYQYGPWIETIIDPCTGLISWIPKFEGAYNAIITCADARGGNAFGEITIFSVTQGTWLNHPPIIKGRPTQPVVIKAGEEFMMNYPTINVEDPDGDQLYASCNIGTCGRAPDGSFIWRFQSNFPGSYLVEIVFFDIRGGYAIMEFYLDVKPWWSY
ncbi:MAG: hypothetical protein ACMUHX_09565 [bacterium]